MQVWATVDYNATKGVVEVISQTVATAAKLLNKMKYISLLYVLVAVLENLVTEKN